MESKDPKRTDTNCEMKISGPLIDGPVKVSVSDDTYVSNGAASGAIVSGAVPEGGKVIEDSLRLRLNSFR